MAYLECLVELLLDYRMLRKGYRKDSKHQGMGIVERMDYRQGFELERD